MNVIALCAIALLGGAASSTFAVEAAVPAELIEQIATLKRIHSGRFVVHSREVQDGGPIPVVKLVTTFILKEDFFSYSEVADEVGHSGVIQHLIGNDKLFCIFSGGNGNLLLVHRNLNEATQRDDIAIGVSMPCPLPLSPLSFLKLANKGYGSAYTFAWTGATNPAWLQKHFAQAVAKVDFKGDEIVLHVPLAFPEVVPGTHDPNEVPIEARIVLTRGKQTCGLSLISKIELSEVGAKAQKTTVIRYGEFPSTDGTPPYVLPVSIVTTNWDGSEFSSETLEARDLNAEVDDSEFEFDATKARTIIDVTDRVNFMSDPAGSGPLKVTP